MVIDLDSRFLDRDHCLGIEIGEVVRIVTDGRVFGAHG